MVESGDLQGKEGEGFGIKDILMGAAQVYECHSVDQMDMCDLDEFKK